MKRTNKNFQKYVHKFFFSDSESRINIFLSILYFNFNDAKIISFFSSFSSSKKLNQL